MGEATYDEQKAEAFLQKMVGVLNGGSLAMMCSLGHRSGLFDSMAQMAPASSTEIAEKSGLEERYVREWLGAMVTGQIIDYDENAQTYHLPAERAACLTREAAPDNLAGVMQWISILGKVEDDILECFQKGGGVPYSRFERFHEVMAEESGQTVLLALFEHILPLVPGLKDRLEEGIDVLDVGCGAGRALNLMASRFPKSRFCGYDISEHAVSSATQEARESELENVRFTPRDVAQPLDSNCFDLVMTFDAIHDQADPAAVLRNIHQALRPGGVYLMQDIRASSHLHKNMQHPIGPLLYTISTMHCMTVSLASGGKGLGTCWGEELAVQMLGEAGFPKTRVEVLEHDVQNNYYISPKE